MTDIIETIKESRRVVSTIEDGSNIWEVNRCERCNIPRDNNHESLCPICLVGEE